MAFLTPGGDEYQPQVIEDPSWGGMPGLGPPGGGAQGPFIPTFGSGSAGAFVFPQPGTWGGAMQRRLQAGRGGAPRSPLARTGNQQRPSGPYGQIAPAQTTGQGMGGMGFGGGSAMQATGNPLIDSLMGRLRSQPGSPWARAAAPQGPDRPFENGALGPIGALLQNAFMGGDPNYGGAFSLNPPQAIMDALRGQTTRDQGAYERAARLGLQSRGDVDPSTYGFQALQSQLQGQDRASNQMNQNALALRQGQLDNYWRLLSQLLGAQVSTNQTEMQGRWAHANQPSGLGGALGGLGGLLGGLGGRGGGGGAAAPRMGQPGFEYPRA